MGSGRAGVQCEERSEVGKGVDMGELGNGAGLSTFFDLVVLPLVRSAAVRGAGPALRLPSTTVPTTTPFQARWRRHM